MFFGVGIEGEDRPSLHVSQSFVVAVRETTKNDLLHRLRALPFMILTERVVISRAINKRDIDGDIPFSDQQVIDEDSPDPSVPINEGRLPELSVETAGKPPKSEEKYCK